LVSNEPKYKPELWGPANDVQYNNNCYNYACDIKGAYAQPGLASGYKFTNFNCDEISQALVADGLVPIDCDKRCGRGSHKVALVILPGKTFHLYRRDSDGRWSHKPGDGAPTNLDYSGNIITDPRTSDRGPFTVFCGCFCLNKHRVSIK
jgi:hypothetical protein